MQMTKECKTATRRKENLIDQLLDVLLSTIESNPARECGWGSRDSQQPNHMALQMITGNTPEMYETTFEKIIDHNF